MGLVCVMQAGGGSRQPAKPQQQPVAAEEERCPVQRAWMGRVGLVMADPGTTAGSTAHLPADWPVLAPYSSGWPPMPQAKAALPSPTPHHPSLPSPTHALYHPSSLPVGCAAAPALPPFVPPPSQVRRRSREGD